MSDRVPRFLAAVGVALLACGAARAADVTLVGVFPGKAVLVIDGRGPSTVAAGSAREGVRVIAVDEAGATLEIDGRRRRVALGSASIRSAGGPAQTLINADGAGHFRVAGRINGRAVRFVVDTGATAVALSSALAQSLGIDPSRGQPITVQTANGPTIAWRVTLDSVAVGDIVAYQVDAFVQQNMGDLVLLGNSFLNRVDMRREGDKLLLVKRY